MGRKRLIVQADLTSEEDQAFLAWVKEKLRRRRLAEEIREGLRLQYERGTGQAEVAYTLYPDQAPHPVSPPHAVIDNSCEDQTRSIKLQRLVQRF